MNKLTRISFNIFKFSAIGFILLFFLATVIVGAAGHSSGDSSSLFAIALFSLILFLLINYYQKRTTTGKRIRLIFKILIVIIILATVLLSILGIFALQQHRIEPLTTFVCLVLGLYSISGFLILKFIFWDNKLTSTDSDKTDHVG